MSQPGIGPNRESARESPTPGGKPKEPSPWVFVSEGTQLAATLLICLFAGYWLDAKKDTLPWFTLGGAVLGIGLGLYSFLRRYFQR